MPRILVVEDEANILEEIMDWLQFEGYEVQGATNGRLGLQAIEQSCPDLIISDVSMPEMDGYELLMEVRSNPQYVHIPFIFLSAAAERAAIRRGMNIGADDYLTKPFTHSEVMNAINARLQKKVAEDAQLQSRVDMLYASLNEEREKNLLKTRLVAMFSHDFRNPLASILSSAGIIHNYEDRLSPERKKQHLERIESSVHLLSQMLDDMLMIAEVEGGYLEFAPKQLDLTTFVREIVEEFRLIDQNMHDIDLDCPFSLLASVDPKLLRHILANLIANAIKYSDTGTRITVRVEPQDHHLTFIVEDRGIGIPADNLQHLFAPFYRADNVGEEKGTGLGLSIVQTCVELHQGRIEVESELQRGTRFIVTIPH